MRMSVPAAFASKNEPLLPGTRIMSPNDVMITSGCAARCMASSTRPIGMTHTGHPGPGTSLAGVPEFVYESHAATLLVDPRFLQGRELVLVGLADPFEELKGRCGLI